MVSRSGADRGELGLLQLQGGGGALHFGGVVDGVFAVLPVPGGLEALACLGERGTGFGGAGAGVVEGLRQLVDDGGVTALQGVVDPATGLRWLLRSAAPGLCAGAAPHRTKLGRVVLIHAGELARGMVGFVADAGQGPAVAVEGGDVLGVGREGALWKTSAAPKAPKMLGATAVWFSRAAPAWACSLAPCISAAPDRSVAGSTNTSEPLSDRSLTTLTGQAFGVNLVCGGL